MNPDKNPYDFMMQDQVTDSGKRQLFSLKSGSKKQRIIQLGAAFGVILVLIGAFLIITGALSGNKSEDLYKMMATQQDIKTLTDKYANGLKTEELINQSATTQALIGSHIAQINAYNSQKNIKNDTKQIKTYQNIEFVQALNAAKLTGEYEESYEAIFNNKLDLYRSQLRTNYQAAKSTTLKNLLEGFYSQTYLLDETKEEAAPAN